MYKIVTKIANSCHKHHKQCYRFTFRTPEGLPIYRDAVSYNAFFNSVKQRNWHNGILYYSRDETEFYNDAKRLAETLNEEVETYEIIDTGTIWEFYKLIGWDHKSQKYYTPS